MALAMPPVGHLERNLRVESTPRSLPGGEVRITRINGRNVFDGLLRDVSPAVIENIARAEIIASFVLNDRDTDVLDTSAKIMARVNS